MRRVAPLAVPILAVLVSVPVPASAYGIGHAAVDLRPVAGGFQVCIKGQADATTRVTGSWQFAIRGERGGVAYTPASVTYTTAAIPLTCTTVSKAGTASGVLTFSLTYTAVGVLDVVAAAAGVAAWDPSLSQDLVLGITD